MRLALTLCALTLSACASPDMPTPRLLQSCLKEGGAERFATVTASRILRSQPTPEASCTACAALIAERGYEAVEFNIARHPKYDRVGRISLAAPGDARCAAFDALTADKPAAPAGRCFALEPNVARSARYVIEVRPLLLGQFSSPRAVARDLESGQVLARAVDFSEGFDAIHRYSCADTEKGPVPEAEPFVLESLRAR